MNKIWIFKKWFSSFNFYKNVEFRLDILGFAGSCTKVYHSMLNSFQYFHINYQMSEEWKIDTAFFRSFYCDIFSTCIYGSSIAKIFAFRTRSLAQPKVIPNRLFEIGKSNFEEKNDVGWEKIVRFLKTIFFRHGIAFWLSSPHHHNSSSSFQRYNFCIFINIECSADDFITRSNTIPYLNKIIEWFFSLALVFTMFGLNPSSFELVNIWKRALPYASVISIHGIKKF